MAMRILMSPSLLGYEAIGGWRFGNTTHGAQAEYLFVPYAQANLAKIPDGVTDEQAVLLADIASTGFAGAEAAPIRLGAAVAVFAQGPIGLCATAGAKLIGAALVIGVDVDDIGEGYRIFGERLDKVMKVAIRP